MHFTVSLWLFKIERVIVVENKTGKFMTWLYNGAALTGVLCVGRSPEYSHRVPCIWVIYLGVSDQLWNCKLDTKPITSLQTITR
jgi:hypothetical protein